MVRLFIAVLLSFTAPAHAQFVAGQPLTAAALNNAFANPHITGGSVSTSVLTGNFSVSNFNSGSGATASTCWLGSASWGACAIAGSGITVTGRTIALSSTPGTVTSVALTVPGIFSVGGSPVTTTGTLAITASGTSGGIPYFSSGSALSSSAALTANLPIIGGGAGGAPAVGTVTGNTTKFATSTGSLTSGNCAKWDASGNAIDAGAPCGTGTTVTIASGTKALATGAIGSAACSSEQTDTATGTATTDVLQSSFAGDPTAVTGYIPSTSGMLTIIGYTKTDAIAYKVCNNTSGSITPGAISINWRVVR